MLEMSICIEMFFQDREFLDRIDAVADLGVPAFEFWGWKSKDIPGIVARQRRHGLKVSAIVVDPQLPLIAPGLGREFADAVRDSAAVARQMACTRVITLADRLAWSTAYDQFAIDVARCGMDRQAQRDCLVAALKAAAPIAESEGITLLLEPLNTLVDHPGYFLVSAQEGCEIVQEVNSPAVKLLFDVYHQQVSEGNLISNIVGHVDMIGYLHVADVPGRHEPGTGEINYLNVLRAASRAGYNGPVGLEYTPSGDALASLKVISQIIDQVNREQMLNTDMATV